MIEYNIQQALNEAYFFSQCQQMLQSVSNDNTKLVETEDDAIDKNREGVRGDPSYGM